jgi:hypothetical protein
MQYEVCDPTHVFCFALCSLRLQLGLQYTPAGTQLDAESLARLQAKFANYEPPVVQTPYLPRPRPDVRASMGHDDADGQFTFDSGALGVSDRAAPPELPASPERRPARVVAAAAPAVRGSAWATDSVAESAWLAAAARTAVADVASVPPPPSPARQSGDSATQRTGNLSEDDARLVAEAWHAHEALRSLLSDSRPAEPPARSGPATPAGSRAAALAAAHASDTPPAGGRASAPSPQRSSPLAPIALSARSVDFGLVSAAGATAAVVVRCVAAVPVAVSTAIAGGGGFFRVSPSACVLEPRGEVTLQVRCVCRVSRCCSC